MQELEAHDKALETRAESLLDLPDEQRAAQRRAIAQARSDIRKPRPAQNLDRQHTDWHWLYRELKREWKNLKGLQNRERIWYVHSYIVDGGSAESEAILDKLHRDYMAKDKRLRRNR